MHLDYDIALATPEDIPGMLALQEANLPDKGGSLSVRLTEDWFRDTTLKSLSLWLAAIAKSSAMSWARHSKQTRT